MSTENALEVLFYFNCREVEFDDGLVKEGGVSVIT